MFEGNLFIYLVVHDSVKGQSVLSLYSIYCFQTLGKICQQIYLQQNQTHRIRLYD